MATMSNKKHHPEARENRKRTTVLRPVKDTFGTAPIPGRRSYEGIVGRIAGAFGAADRGRVLLVVGASEGVGTSTVARLMSRTLADGPSARVILVDANLRTPAQHAAFDVRPSRGLSEVVENVVPLEEAANRCVAPGLFLLPSGKSSGSSPVNTLANLNKRNVLDELRANFEWIVIDAPPIVTHPETGILARQADGTILVVRAEKTRGPAAEKARRLLQEADARILGAVLNRRRFHIPSWLYRWF